MTKAAWCRENGVNLRQLFYWQRKLRDMALEASGQLPQLHSVSVPSTTFCEISAPKDNQPSCLPSVENGLVVEINGFRILVGNSFSKKSLASVVEVLRYV